MRRSSCGTAASRAPIVVLYPVPPSFVADAAALGDRGDGRSGALLDALVDAVVARGAAAASPLDVHVEVETGLGRGASCRSTCAMRWTGCAASRRPRWRASGRISPHPRTPSEARAQEAIFERVLGSPGRVRRRRAADDTSPPAARSWPGPCRLRRRQTRACDLRPGAGRLRFDAASGRRAALRPVMALVARPVRVVDLPAGHGVGYGPGVRHPAAVAAGDAARRLRRRLERGPGPAGEALVRGVAVPLVGRVAMDAVVADVTDVPGPPVDEADEFVLLGSTGRERDRGRRAGASAHHESAGRWSRRCLGG